MCNAKGFQLNAQDLIFMSFTLTPTCTELQLKNNFTKAEKVFTQ